MSMNSHRKMYHIVRKIVHEALCDVFPVRNVPCQEHIKKMRKDRVEFLRRRKTVMAKSWIDPGTPNSHGLGLNDDEKPIRLDNQSHNEKPTDNIFSWDFSVRTFFEAWYIHSKLEPLQYALKKNKKHHKEAKMNVYIVELSVARQNNDTAQIWKLDRKICSAQKR